LCTRPEALLGINLFDDVPRAQMVREDVRIERIVSTGQSTPANQPLSQGHDEWVLLLAGSAGLCIEGHGERNVRRGDHVLVAAQRAHSVTCAEPTSDTDAIADRALVSNFGGF
jgi:cupin 2 domain-containing protein